jgi:hypothetical protein
MSSAPTSWWARIVLVMTPGPGEPARRGRPF